MGSAIRDMHVLPDYRLKFAFVNGSEAVIDMKKRVKGMRFGALSDPELFAAARLERDEIVWSRGGITIRAPVNEVIDSMLMY